jgi:hypothetical protein
MRRGNNAEHTPYLPNPLSTSPGNAEIGHMGTRICALTSCVGSGDVCSDKDSFRSQCTAPLHCACLISSLREFLKQNASSA